MGKVDKSLVIVILILFTLLYISFNCNRTESIVFLYPAQEKHVENTLPESRTPSLPETRSSLEPQSKALSDSGFPISITGKPLIVIDESFYGKSMWSLEEGNEYLKKFNSRLEAIFHTDPISTRVELLKKEIGILDRAIGAVPIHCHLDIYQRLEDSREDWAAEFLNSLLSERQGDTGDLNKYIESALSRMAGKNERAAELCAMIIDSRESSSSDGIMKDLPSVKVINEALLRALENDRYSGELSIYARFGKALNPWLEGVIYGNRRTKISTGDAVRLYSQISNENKRRLVDGFQSADEGLRFSIIYALSNIKKASIVGNDDDKSNQLWENIIDVMLSGLDDPDPYNRERNLIYFIENRDLSEEKVLKRLEGLSRTENHKDVVWAVKRALEVVKKNLSGEGEQRDSRPENR